MGFRFLTGQSREKARLCGSTAWMAEANILLRFISTITDSLFTLCPMLGRALAQRGHRTR